MKKRKSTKGIVFCVHGNEQASLSALDIAKKYKLKKDLKAVVANFKAIKRNARFIDSDLNRVFPGKIDGNYEERLAFGIKDKLDSCHLVIDLHTSNRKTPPFIITTKISRSHIDLARGLGISKLVIMHPKLAKGKSLIDHCRCGVSVELGRHNSPEAKETAVKVVENFLYGSKHTSLEIYKVERILKKPTSKFSDNLENFKLVNKGNIIYTTDSKAIVADEDFYPVLSGEGNYTDMLCLVCKRINPLE